MPGLSLASSGRTELLKQSCKSWSPKDRGSSADERGLKLWRLRPEFESRLCCLWAGESPVGRQPL